jgi:L-amino acid N-acyltransferase YncA
MKPIYGQKERVGRFVAERITCGLDLSAYEAIGLEDLSGELIAGVVFTDHITGGAYSMHVAGTTKRWATRDFLYRCFAYVFIQCKCKVAVAVIASDNTDSIRLAKNLGFIQSGSIKNGFGYADMEILTMQDTQCKWIKLKRVTK